MSLRASVIRSIAVATRVSMMFIVSLVYGRIRRKKVTGDFRCRSYLLNTVDIMASLQFLLVITVAFLAALYVADGRSMRSVSLRQTNSSLQEYAQVNQKFLTDSLQAWTNWANETSVTNITQATQAGLKLFGATTNATSEAITKGTGAVLKGITNFFSFFG